MAQKRGAMALSTGIEDSEQQVAALLERHKPYLQREEDGRVRCTLNGHVMPAVGPIIEAFVSGAKFQRRKKQEDDAAGFKSYEPFLIPSKNQPDKLYCAMTCMLVNKSMDSVRRHLKGKAFLKTKEKYERDEHELMEEPELEDTEEPSEAEGSTQPAELAKGMQGMDLNPARITAEGQREAAMDTSALTLGADQPFPDEPKKKKKSLDRKKQKSTEDLPQPRTPPQKMQDAGCNLKPANRIKTRERVDGSRPKKLKRSSQ